MTREFTCILCPNGCSITAASSGSQSYTVTGAGCPKGRDYVLQELRDPQRTIATSVAVEGGELPLVSVRVDAPIPKAMIFSVMKEINRLHIHAPVQIGQILIANVSGLNSNVIATRNVDSSPANPRRTCPQKLEEV